MLTFPVPLLGFAAYSGTGKTTLLTRLIPLLKAHGLRCAAIKHSHHDFDIDVPGKDSHRMREAGAEQVVLASPHRTFWVAEGDGHTEPGLAELVGRLDLDRLDLVLVEGFRHEAMPKIEVHRPSRNKPLISANDSNVIALACDAPPQVDVRIPMLPLNEPAAVAAFIVDWLGSRTA